MPSLFSQIFSSSKKASDKSVDTYSIYVSEGRDAGSIYYYVPKAEQKRENLTKSEMKSLAKGRAFICPASLSPVFPMSRI
jgi:hypothetical protein